MFKEFIINSDTKTINLPELRPYTTRQFLCRGCENECMMSELKFDDKSKYLTGNKCEKIHTNKGADAIRGQNHYSYKQELIRSYIRPPVKNNPLTLGIPMGLNMYENFPFWSEFLSNCGINVVVSDISTYKLYEKGTSTVMSDNICFPAKLMHGHIFNLLEQKVDRIFFPYIVYEQKDAPYLANSFNCPIVSAYSEVISSAIDTAQNYNTPLDAPTIDFNNKVLLKKACRKYLKSLNINLSNFDRIFEKALEIDREFKHKLKQNCLDIVNNSATSKKPILLVAGRPYHTDPLIQHKLTDMISDFGVDVISEDIIRNEDYGDFIDLNTVSQ